MSLISVGMNHRNAPIELLERVTIQPDTLTKALVDLAGRAHLTEVVVLSTCNRTEVFAVAEKFHGAYGDIRDFFIDHCGLSAQDCTDHLQTIHDTDAVRHLFAVASGLDSIVLGESEILGQVKRAWMHAQEHHSAGPTLNLLFRHAINTGKRARSETAIGRSITSMAHAAVALAEQQLNSLHEAKVLVIGAGEIATNVVRALQRHNPATISVANRSPRRANALVEEFAVQVVPFDELYDAACRADVVISATGSSDVIVHRSAFQTARGQSTSPLLVIDIAMPRDIDPGITSLPGVSLMDMRHVQFLVDTGLRNRRSEVKQVTEIVDANVDTYLAELTARRAAPLVADLHTMAEQVRMAEITKATSRLDDLTDGQRNQLEALTKAIVAKLIHEPTARLKSEAGTPRGDRLAEALRELFDL